ncbi:hypothetical protein [Agrococcus terreus]|uniref:hypothetical protein n=1 Tax=Agrococcus terreus TaxID=574649 RepID=UPI00384C853B
MQSAGLAASTIRTRVGNVRAVLRAAARDRVIARDPSEASPFLGFAAPSTRCRYRRRRL